MGYLAFLFRSSNSEQDINLTDVHYSRPAIKYNAYFMYPAFLFSPSIFLAYKVHKVSLCDGAVSVMCHPSFDKVNLNSLQDDRERSTNFFMTVSYSWITLKKI